MDCVFISNNTINGWYEIWHLYITDIEITNVSCLIYTHRCPSVLPGPQHFLFRLLSLIAQDHPSAVKIIAVARAWLVFLYQSLNNNIYICGKPYFINILKMFHIRNKTAMSSLIAIFTDVTSIFITRGQFWPSGIVVACICVCVSVCLWVNHLLVRAITRDPFKLGSPNLDQRCKRPWLRSLLFWGGGGGGGGGAIDLDLQGQI